MPLKTFIEPEKLTYFFSHLVGVESAEDKTEMYSAREIIKATPLYCPPHFALKSKT